LSIDQELEQALVIAHDQDRPWAIRAIREAQKEIAKLRRQLKDQRSSLEAASDRARMRWEDHKV